MYVRNWWLTLKCFGEPGSGGNSSNTGVVVGAVVGVIVLLVILALVLYYLCVYKRKKQPENSLILADPLFTRSGGNYSGSASDQIHSSEYHYLKCNIYIPVLALFWCSSCPFSWSLNRF